MNGEIHDVDRIDYIQQHLEYIQKAIADGIDCRGCYV